jgi:phosphatidylglycerophosphatase A
MWDEFCSFVAVLLTFVLLSFFVFGYLDLKKESMKVTPCQKCGHVNTKEKE